MGMEKVTVKERNKRLEVLPEDSIRRGWLRTMRNEVVMKQLERDLFYTLLLIVPSIAPTDMNPFMLKDVASAVSVPTLPPPLHMFVA
jgi:hypothetical protein